ncbi:MAG: hypothetical protein FJ030_16250 [Chloroflexi bacterium]|nr:hypothetical protein [Chloroflexota bacterium]
MSFLIQAFAVVTSPEGSAIYHILTLFALEAAFAIALGHWWRHGSASQSVRLTIGAGLAGGARALLFALGALGANGLFPAPAILAPLDRAIALLTIALIGWALIFRPGKRWADVLAGFGIVGIVILYIALALQWYPVGIRGEAYNPYDTIWELAKLGAILLALVGLLIFRPADWGLGFGLFLTLLAGVLYHLLDPIITDNYPAAQRIAEMAALPLFTVIAYRHALGPPPAPAPTPPPAQPPLVATTPPAKVALTPQAAAALAHIAAGSEDAEFAQRISEAVGRTLLADITLVFAPPANSEDITCASAFDLIRDMHLPGFTIPTRRVNTVVSALTRGRPARLRLDSHLSELNNLSLALGIPQTGPAIMVPFAEEESGQNMGGVLVMSSFTQKEWAADDHHLLASIARPLAKAFARMGGATQQTAELIAELERAQLRAANAEAEVSAAQERAARLASEFEEAKEEAKRNLLQAQSLAAVIQAEAATPQPAEPEDSPEVITLQNSYRRSLEELASLNERLTQAQSAIDQLRDDLASKDIIHADALAAIQAERERIAQALADAHAEIEQLEQQPAAAPAPFTLDSIEDSIALNAKLEQSRAEIERLTDELTDSRAAVAGLADIQKQLADSRADIDRLTKELAAAQAAPPSLDATDLQNQLANARRELDRLRAHLTAADTGNASPLQSQTAVLVSLIQDLRQPLSSIIGYTDLLLGESVGIIGALQRNLLDRVEASAERMTTTLDDLIRLTAIDSGTLTLEAQDFEIVEVIEDAFTSVGAQFREKSISLRMDIADDIPTVEADRDAIFQIISRLLTNACAASKPNSEVIFTARAQTDNTLLLSVRDTGGGITEKDRDRVFARFYRADRPLIQGLGDTGVGLSIAKALTEAQGGRIWVDSEMGAGSTFHVSLPTNGHH